ncbi:ras-related protein Rab-44 [Sturnira hondurensis]|uniref:ras-related protein Rab-44 n=1 Tax=Sturnira hondurensis TaxID=192404 RepID=UPI00187ABCD4|nr:ras-related protein Rab-44 [Sturnira hondurensis]
MEPGQRVIRKGRKLGSSRRRQIREPTDGQDAPVAPGPESWSSQAAAELQTFFQACGAKERGFVTREDLEVAKFSFLSREEQPEMIFDWVDVEQKGHLSLEEFSSGFKSIFGSSPSTHRLHRRKPLSSKRGSAVSSFPVLEEAEAEEKEAFFAFMEQLGAGHSLSEQTELWQLWGKLRQEEPQLAGNLEGFLAKMTSRLQEARADKEVLELTLQKRDSDHRREVQQLYEEMEQQIRQEKQQLQAESDSRDVALSSQMQEVLEAKEREVQQLTEGQRELEAQLHHLSSTHQEANLENWQLREAQHDLAGQLEEVREQLQVTRGHLNVTKSYVSWQMEEKLSDPRAGVEKAPNPQPAAPEETPLPGLFGDNDDWDQLLSSFSSSPHRTLQLCWSPPPTPTASSAPQTPRVVRQISISEPHGLLFGQGPTSDADGAPRTPPEVSSGAKEGKAVDPDGQDLSPVQPKEEPGAGPEAHFLWDLPRAPSGESGSLVAAALKVLIPLEDGHPLQVASPPSEALTGTSKQFRASYPDDKDSWTGPVPAKPARQGEALYQESPATGSEPRPGSPGARALTAGLAEPSQGLECVVQASTEGSEQGRLGPDVQEGYPGVLREAHVHVQPGGLPALPQQSLEEEPRAEEGKQVGQGGQDLSSEQPAEVQGLRTGHWEQPQRDSLPSPLPCDTLQAQAETEAPAPGTPSPPRGSPTRGAQPGVEAGPQLPTKTQPSVASLEAQPRLPHTTAQAEGGQEPLQSGEPRAEDGPEDLGTDSREAGLHPPRGHPADSEPPADPDHIFHVIVLGDSNVGKTSFLHLLHQNSFATGLTATVGVDFRVKKLLVDNKCYALQLWDTAGQERYHSMTRQLLRKADGVLLMYDVTSQDSFAHVRYWLDCIQDSASGEVAVLLLGNKMDCDKERRVSTEAGQQLAQELGISFAECSAALGHNILEPMADLARSLKAQEDHLKGSLVEVAPERPPKKAGCCS